jgi:TRAP-type C4-dicarboxylate transport system permease small subunit
MDEPLMGSPLTRVNNVVDRLISLSSIIGTLALIFIVLVILIDVVGRLFGTPLTGAQDLSQMTMVIIVFGGMALCDKLGGNIAVDIFEDKFSPRMNHWLDIVGWLIGAAIFVGIAYTMLDAAALAKMLNLSTNTIGIPKAPFQYVLAGFAALTALSMLIRSVAYILSPDTEYKKAHEEEL